MESEGIEGMIRRRRYMMLTTLLLLALAVGPSEVRANPSSPSVAAGGSPAPALELLGRWHGGPVYASAVSGDYVYFGMGGVIRVLKIEQGTSSWREVASIASSGVVRGLDASAGHLYVADDSGALRIIDISVPDNPKETGHVELPAVVRAVSVKGRYAYLAAGWEGLVAIDVSNPEQPRVAHTHKTPGYALDVHRTGSLALVADARRGLRLIDVSNPLQPREVGH